MQAGRALVSSFEDAQKGKRLGAGVAYLGSKSIRKAKCPSDDKVGDLAIIDQAWGCVASMVVEKAAKAYDAFVAKGKGRDEALELCSQQRFIAAKGASAAPEPTDTPVHTSGSIFRQFRLALKELAETEPKESNVVQTLEKVARLYGLWAVEEHAQYFLQAGYYSAAQIDAISEIVTDLCAELRKDAVSLTDAFCYTDVRPRCTARV